MTDYKKLCEELRDDDMTCCECDRRAECNGEPGCLIRHDAADAITKLQAENERRVEVVHCKDCLEAKRSENAFADADCTIPLYECGYMTQPNRGHEFCSWGRRKEQV